jgi:hypothetical protein
MSAKKSNIPDPPDQVEFETELRRIYKRRDGSMTSLANWFGRRFTSSISRQLDPTEPTPSYPYRFVLWLLFIFDPTAEAEVWQLVCEARSAWRGHQQTKEGAARQIKEIVVSQMRGKTLAEQHELHSLFYTACHEGLQESKTIVTQVFQPAGTGNDRAA